MSEYINREDTLDAVLFALVGTGHQSRAIWAIRELPTADVVEVRHGTWYNGNDGGAVYAKCSACGRKMNYSCYGYAYCSLCGAKMDGERREENENH